MTDSDFATLLSKLDLTTVRAETPGAMVCIFASWPPAANDHCSILDQLKENPDALP